MTTGRINQVRTVGGAVCSRRAPPRGPGREHARAPGPLELCRRARGPGPSGPGGVAPAGAHSPTPGLRRPRLAGPRPRLLLSPSRSRSERRRHHASSRGAPLGTVRPRTVTRTKACDPSAAASALPLGRLPPVETPPGYAAVTTRLTPRARLDATAHRRQDTDAPGRPSARAALCHLAEPSPWPPPEALPP